MFQAIAWESGDTDEGFMITIYGRTQDGKTVSVSTLFPPYFFIKLPPLETPESLAVQLGTQCKAIRAKSVWGFTNNELQTFVKCEFQTLSKMRECVWACRRKKFKVFESAIDPLLRFMHRSGIQSVGWFEIRGDHERDFSTTCAQKYFVKDWQSLKPIDRDDIAPFKIMSIDIECYSKDRTFPDAEKRDDTLFQIAMTTKTYGGGTEQKCLTLGTSSIGDTFASERELLDAFTEYLHTVDPDVITGWNIFGFDLEYIYKRMVLAKCDPATFCLGRRRDQVAEIKIKNLASSALGSNVLKMLPMTGRYVFDLFQVVKAEHKLESYSLNNVSKEFLGDAKVDMPIHEMFKRFETSSDLTEVAEYCLKDTELPIRLMEKLCTFENLVEMAKATWVPLSFLSERGQQIKVMSQIARKARELNFMIPTLFEKIEQPKYEGATVLEAQTGAYYKPITALDFASLYPSIMMAHNLCYSTLVMNPKYLGLPGVEYETHGEFTFAQNVTSLLPAVLSDLKQFRKKAKEDMKKFPHMYNIYNGKQLAYKISMNSVYGFTGAANGMLPCVAIASTTTRRGRQMIQESKEYVEENFPGAKVRYGDSVMPGTPVLTEDRGPVTIESLGTNWVEYPGFMKDGTDKEQCELNGVRVWTSSGWSDVKRVIRHKCQKKIYRVLTHTGLVDVTEDHSLLGPNKELLKPKDVTIGTELLHGFPIDVQQVSVCSIEQAYIYGMFVGDGSCGLYTKKHTWAINNSDYELLMRCKELLENITQKSFKILNTLESSGVYKLVPNHGNIRDLQKQYREVCYDGLAKKVPMCVLGNQDTRSAFIRGLWDSDGCRKDNMKTGCHRIDTKNQITAQWYFLLLRLSGFAVSLNTRNDKPNIFRLTWTYGSFRKLPHSIKKIQVLHENYDGYVYDLETSDGTFQAGVGQMIVKNTDSIMVEFDVGDRTGKDAIEYSWLLGERASKQVTQLFKKPNDLELEKVYCPYFLYSKKRYAAKKWTHNGTECVFDEIDIKGLQVVRRDNCPFTRETCERLIDMILESSDPKPPLDYIEERKKQLLSGQISMNKLILSKRLGDSYKNQNLAHVVVRNKMRERAPGSEPQSGDRVQFVIVEHPNKRAKMYEKSEDPKWVAEHPEIRLDYQYYLKHNFETPVSDLLEPLLS